MTLGFLVLRKGFLKVLGATIQAAVDRGHRAVLIWDPVELKPGEAVSEAELGAWPAAARVIWTRGTPLLPLLHSAGIEALIAPSLYYVLRSTIRDAGIAELGRAGIGLYSVDYATYERNPTLGATVLGDIAGARRLDTATRVTYGGLGPMTPEPGVADDITYCFEAVPPAP